MKKFYVASDPSLGGAFWPIVKLIEHFNDVKHVPYTGQKKGVCLFHNVLPQDVPSSLRRIVFVGGYKTREHGIPRKFKWNKADHCVFQSEFFRRIAQSRYKIKRSSVIHILGGAHGDPNIMEPVTSKAEPLDGEIHFIMVAKWWKRFYKRFGAHVNLFVKHILPLYPKAILHIFGQKKMKEEIKRDGSIIAYRKTFHSDVLAKAYRQSHIQLILTPFDSGPMTLNESMHYRVPFICGNNSCAAEFVSMVDGICGEVVKIDPQMENYKDCKRYKPMADKSFYGRALDNELIMDAVHRIVNNYPKYTSWNWTEDFSYKGLADKWMSVLFG